MYPRDRMAAQLQQHLVEMRHQVREMEQQRRQRQQQQHHLGGRGNILPHLMLVNNPPGGHINGGGVVRFGPGGIVNRYQGLVHYPLNLRGEGPPAPRHRLVPWLKLIKMDGDILSYDGESGDQPGMYIAPNPIEYYNNYFEIQILDVGELGQITVGLVPEKYPLNVQPGIGSNSVGYLTENGKISLNYGRGMREVTQQGPVCGMGDKIGVGIKMCDEPARPDRHSKRRVFFTKNGQEIKFMDLGPRFGVLHPAVGMQSEGEEVSINLGASWNPEDVMQMLVDCGEDDWIRLDDIRLNGNTLEYTGRGHSIQDVGLAQAKLPLDTTNHYFEFEIVDPGEKGYLAIGLARRNYPKRRHPGWNRGSIAYHADDGKLFHGSGIGINFGPKCSLGDIMGCGIFFPLDYENEAEDQDEEGEGEVGPLEDEVNDDPINNFLWDSDEEDDYPGWPAGRGGQPKEKGKKVKVFFKRNGKLIGLREVTLPKGGFFPTIGMTSLNEKVRVDLRPMTG